jgi:hypothetical protein
MSIRNTPRTVALAVALGGLIVPVFAQTGSGDMQGAPDQDKPMGRMGQGMMQGGMMSHGLMASCSGMMQSMNNSDGLPNSQWRRHSPDGSDNGG